MSQSQRVLIIQITLVASLCTAAARWAMEAGVCVRSLIGVRSIICNGSHDERVEASLGHSAAHYRLISRFTPSHAVIGYTFPTAQGGETFIRISWLGWPRRIEPITSEAGSEVLAGALAYLRSTGRPCFCLLTGSVLGAMTLREFDRVAADGDATLWKLRGT